MKKKSTLVLLVAVLLLGTCIWLQESWRARMPSREYRRIKLFALDATTLVSLELKYTNSVINCVKENGAWMAGESDSGLGKADSELVQQLVFGLNRMGKGTTITARHLEIRGLDASEYGFDSPMLEITAIDSKGRQSWQIGRKTPLGDMVYVREGNAGDIYTVPDQILGVVPKKADELRDRRLFSGGVAGMRRVEIRGPNGFIQMHKDLETGWHIQQPISASADAVAVERYIGQLMQLRVDEFMAENVSDFLAYGLQSERQISLGELDGTARMLVLGDEVPERPGFIYARRADDTSVFALKASVLELLQVEDKQFRNADVLALDPEQISDVSITFGDDQLSLVRDDAGQWQMLKPVAWAAENAAVEELLKIWKMVVITDFSAPASDAPVEWVLGFGSKQLGVTNTVSVLAAAGKEDGLLIRKDGDKELYQINLPLLPELMRNPLHYKNREIWRLDRADIQKVTRRTNGEPAGTLERQADGSMLATELDGGADPERIDELMNMLTLIRTSEFVAHNPKDIEIYGLAAPTLELQLGLSGSADLGRVLLIGRETPQGFYSMVKGRDVIFYLSKRLVAALSIELSHSEG